MACAGTKALRLLHVAVAYPRLGLTLSVAGATAPQRHSPYRPAFGTDSAEWLRLIVDRSPYLFVSNWKPDYCARATVTLATLIVGLYFVSGALACILCQADPVRHLIVRGACLVYHSAVVKPAPPPRPHKKSAPPPNSRTSLPATRFAWR